MAEISPSSLVDPRAARAAFGLPALDATPPPFRLLLLAIQHVLSLYAGAVTVPLVVGAALHLASDQTAYLVSSDLLACGLVTLVQCLGVGGVGVRLPVMMGVTFVAVGPLWPSPPILRSACRASSAPAWPQA